MKYEKENMRDNSWYEKGELPPVGMIVSYYNSDENPDPEGTCTDDWKNGDNLEVLAFRKVNGSILPIVFNIRDETASCLIIQYIRPIKSDREKAIEEMKEIVNSVKADVLTQDLFLGAIYDAGYRKADK